MPSMVKAIDMDKSFDMGKKKERLEKKNENRCISVYE